MTNNRDLLVLEFAVRSAAGFLFLPKENAHCNFPSCQICKSQLHSAVKELFSVKLGRFTSKIFKVKKSVRLRQLAQTSAST